MTPPPLRRASPNFPSTQQHGTVAAPSLLPVACPAPPTGTLCTEKQDSGQRAYEFYPQDVNELSKSDQSPPPAPASQ